MNDKFIKSFANVCYAISGYISTNTRKKQHFYTYFSENETISIKTRMLQTGNKGGNKITDFLFLT